MSFKSSKEHSPLAITGWLVMHTDKNLDLLIIHIASAAPLINVFMHCLDGQHPH